MEDIINHIKDWASLSNEAKFLIKERFIPETFRQNTMLIRSGSVVRHIYFLSKGFIKGFQFQKGKVVVDHLIAPGEFFTSLESFTKEGPTVETFQAISDCTVFKIGKVDFDWLNRELPAFQEFSTQLMNRSLNCKMERIQDFQTLSAKERYLKLIQQQPMVVRHTSIQDLASYLGIEPPFLEQ
ncbi:MAG: Crp/Fnr family transcriptional regulator [Bacteroidota bacterium]